MAEPTEPPSAFSSALSWIISATPPPPEAESSRPPSPVISGLNGSLIDVSGPVYCSRVSLDSCASDESLPCYSPAVGVGAPVDMLPPVNFEVVVVRETEDEKRDRIKREFEEVAKEAMIEYDQFLDFEFTKMGL
ncbi:hypothetical protein BT69DRAFT_1330396 [Atractiella rhizophila]|nr:hypothetical protein BT69DRAFT_1330396 [Atractiella rhizophila]